MDQDRLDQILDRHQGQASALIHVLMAIQHENHWLPRDVLETVGRRLGVPFSRVMQVATFYKTFSLVPRGRHEVHVCTGTSCNVRGSARLLGAVQEAIGIRPGETDAGARFSLDTGACLGCCNSGPDIVVDGRHHGRVAPDGARDVLTQYE